ncbi:MAG TPA: DegV family protein [Actinopolymorphaceae bacterium]|jgi:DegV family protein with EDD domain
MAIRVSTATTTPSTRTTQATAKKAAKATAKKTGKRPAKPTRTTAKRTSRAKRTERVAVVTDSTACLSDVEVARYDITVVPLHVVVGDSSCADGGSDARRRLAQAFRGGERVTTSRPSPQSFLEAYRAVAARGATHVVSIHLSADLSSTHDAARLGALQADVPVSVVDSRQVGMGLGFAVLTAARAAREGADAKTVADLARRCAAATQTLVTVDPFGSQRSDGRFGAARAFVGFLLAAKRVPVLRISSGQLELLTSSRTTTSAVAELERRTRAEAQRLLRGDLAEVEIAVHHLEAPARAAELAERLGGAGRGIGRVVIREADGVMGAHLGPGMVGAVVSPVLSSQPAVT